MKTDIKRETRSLMALRADNVAEVFKRELHKWRVMASSEVIVDDEALNGMERAMLLLLGRKDKEGNNTAKNIKISDVDKNGIPLTFERFINNQLNKYEPLYSETIKSNRFNDENAQLKLYINFLKSYKVNEKEPTNLKEFFPNIPDDMVNALQVEFKDLKGKAMAVLIYLLTKEYDKVCIDNSDRHGKSNLHFVRAFTEDKELKNINSVNNYLEGVTGELKKINKKDKTYIEILKRLEPIVSNG